MSDWSEQEYKAILTAKSEPRSDIETYEPIEGGTLDPIDWRDHNCVNKIKNQGSCGSSWAFSTVAEVESAYCIQHDTLYSLSE